MAFKIGKLYKNYKRLQGLISLVKKALKAGGWLFGAYKKRSARQEYVTREPERGWQKPAGKASRRWQPPNSAKSYLKTIAQAEQQHGIPDGVLARLIYQECRYRDDIICGKVVSSVGAVGTAQIVPRWHPEARPLDPEHSIFYAARYLAQLNRQFNHWPTALAAYNWGPGNVNKARKQHGDCWLDNAPKETRNYVSQIGGDTGLL